MRLDSPLHLRHAANKIANAIHRQHDDERHIMNSIETTTVTVSTQQLNKTREALLALEQAEDIQRQTEGMLKLNRKAPTDTEIVSMALLAAAADWAGYRTRFIERP